MKRTKMRRSSLRVVSAILAVVFAIGCLPLIGSALPGDGPDDWQSYSEQETIVLENEYENRTEEEIGVLPVGRYRLSIPGVGYVTYVEEDNQPLVISQTDENDLYTVIYQVTGDKPNYTLSPGDDVYRVLGTSSTYSVYAGNVLRCNNRTFYTSVNSNNGYYRTTEDYRYSMRWYFEDNGNGTVRMALYDMIDPNASNAWRFYAYYDENSGQIVLKRDTQNLYTAFKLEMVERGTDQFDQHISYGGRVTLRLPKAAKTDAGLTDDRAAKWANDAERAYWYFRDLTAFAPYENIIVKAYANCDYMAYVTGSYNTITVSYSATANDFGPVKTWYVDDIGEMVQRGEAVNDWNFCIMHEMGHMFDSGRGWNFETECLTDFKLAYCLYRGGACAVPSEFSATDIFTYDNIEVCYKRLGGDFKSTYQYSFYGAAYKMMLMQKRIGWGPIYRAFHWYSENAALPANEQTAIPNNKYGKFQLFIDKISEYSGVDVQHECFTEVDWAVFMNYYGNPDYPEPPTEPDPEDGAVRIKVFPSFGHIENWSGKTYFIVSITADDNASIFEKLRNSTYALKAIVTDETAGVTYTVYPYHFNTPGDEFYGTSFFRLCFTDYGMEPMPGHEYTVGLDIFEGDARRFTGVSADGAFLSSQDAFNTNGAIMPANPRYDCEITCMRHSFGAPTFTWNAKGIYATCAAVCAVCGESAEYPSEMHAEGNELVVTAEINGTVYSDRRAFVRGDVSGNGSLSIQDVTLLLDILTMNEEQIDALIAEGTRNVWAADADGNGQILISDVSALLDALSS